ncbi:hypothetical protein CAEBREN_12955 [Caenorhabditis brenneri]|uniref:Uncharacterized protein n=1 Tax=Caenorhabditis brenneri TaxID=135651 RepID=G0MDS0_CAEBE|nr:hypothetical protein CAEBREN_12955 [Caenorhabditis brenneri]
MSTKPVNHKDHPVNNRLVIPPPSVELVEQAAEIMEMVATLTENTCRLVPRTQKPMDINFKEKKDSIEATLKVILICLEKAETQEEIDKCEKIADRTNKVYERFEKLEKKNEEYVKWWEAKYGGGEAGKEAGGSEAGGSQPGPSKSPEVITL